MASKVLVVGSGCMGLRTSMELLRKNIQVVLRSARPPLHSTTCSQGAGGLWMPFHCPDDRLPRWSQQTLDELIPLTHSPNDPVEWLPNVQLKKINHLYPDPSNSNAAANGTGNGNGSGNGIPEWTNDERLQFQAMSLDMLFWQNNIHQLRLPDQKLLEESGYLYNWLFFSPVVDPPKMLQKMYKEIIHHKLAVDVNVNTGTKYTSLDEMVQEAMEHNCDAIVNCTGLGSQSLCHDTTLHGARGVLFHYDRNCLPWKNTHTSPDRTNDVVLGANDPPFGGGDQPCYMIPRGDVLVVGGSYLEQDGEVGIRPSEREQLEQNARVWGIDTDNVKPIGEWTGFRPSRSEGVRLEVDEVVGVKEGVKVVHNYGHGGSGWTVYVGAAKEVTKLLEKSD